MKTDRLMAVLIPILFALGLSLFFVLMPSEMVNLSSFIAYTASLSTIIMVLVFVFTTSLQLRSMQQQLEEMKYSRNVEVQPLIYPTEAKFEIELPNYYVLPEHDFKKISLMSRIFVSLKLTNVGNGPAVEVDIIPKLVQLKYHFGCSYPEDVGEELLDSRGSRLECISLKEGDSKEIHFMFFDEKQKFASSILKESFGYLTCIITFKNAVGMTFKESIAFTVYGTAQPEKKRFKLCLKLANSAEIDFNERTREYEKLMQNERKDEAHKIAEQLVSEMKSRYQGCPEQTLLGVELTSGSFSIHPISDSEYKTILSAQDAKAKKVRS